MPPASSRAATTSAAPSPRTRSQRRASTRSGKRSVQTVSFKQVIDRDLAKKIIKIIKDAKLKVDPKMDGDTVRVSGKKRDDLQAAIALVRKAEIEQPLQFENFRD